MVVKQPKGEPTKVWRKLLGRRVIGGKAASLDIQIMKNRDVELVLKEPGIKF